MQLQGNNLILASRTIAKDKGLDKWLCDTEAACMCANISIFLLCLVVSSCVAAHLHVSVMISASLTPLGSVPICVFNCFWSETESSVVLQAAICEIHAGRWVRNGSQIRSQVRFYDDCHFCNSMQDLDIFMLQVKGLKCRVHDGHS